MANIRKLYEADKTTQLFPQTHEKAVVDDYGNTVDSKMGQIVDLVNSAQLEIGAVPIDLVPTAGNTTHVVSSAGIKNAMEANISRYGFTDLMGQTLLACMRNVAWTTDEGASLYAALEEAINHVGEITSISAVYNQTHYIYEVSPLDNIRQDLSVYAELASGVTIPITNYMLSGTLTVGTSVVSVTYYGFTTSVNVVVTEYGTRMSYSISDGDMVRYNQHTIAPLTSDSTIQSIQTALNTARDVVMMPVGYNRMKFDGGSFTNYYPIPVPTSAIKCTITISSGYVFGARGLFYIQDNYHLNPDTTSASAVISISGGWSSGQSYTLEFGEYAGRTDLFLIINVKKTNNGVISPTDNYNVQITFAES